MTTAQEIQPFNSLSLDGPNNDVNLNTPPILLSSNINNTTSENDERGPQNTVYGIQRDSDLISNCVLLKITIIDIDNLSTSKLPAIKPNPQVLITLKNTKTNSSIGQIIHTTTKKRTINPTFNETFYFRVILATGDGELLYKLSFVVQDDKNVHKTKKLGYYDLELTRNLGNGQEYLFDRKLLGIKSNKTKKNGSKMKFNLQKVETLPPDFLQNEPTQASSRNRLLEGVTKSRVYNNGDNSITNSKNPKYPEIPALPNNWEIKKTSTGRIYYVDHVNKKTQWEHPITGEKAKKVKNSDNEIARLYQTRGNTLTQEQSQTEGNEPGPIQSLNVNQSLQNDTNNNQSSSKKSTNSTKKLQPENQNPKENLPKGWEKRKEDHSGRVYYVDHINKRTQWNPPGTESKKKTINDSQNFNLPDGWELRTTKNGRRFFIDHKTKKTTWEDPRRKAKQVKKVAGNKIQFTEINELLGPLPAGWEKKLHKDGREFFVDHNNQITQWEDPRLAETLATGPEIEYRRDFQQKYSFFKTGLRKLNNGLNIPSRCELKIKRDSILDDSFSQIMAKKDPSHLRSKLWIEFVNEKGLDYGGVAREWFYLLSKEMFNPYYGLFEYAANDNYILQINPNSGTFQAEHLRWFQFIGRVTGMAIFHGKLLDVFFIRPFYKMMLGKDINLKDMESVDPTSYKSLCDIKDNDPTDWGLTFSAEDEVKGTVDYIPNGRNVDVNENNKMEYIKKVVEWRLSSRITKQMQAFMKGFQDIINKNLILIFDAKELELLTCGYADVDIKDWKKNTLYKGNYQENTPVIQWFWKAILLMDGESRIRLLQFVTGTSRVPMNGFRELQGSNGPQKFTIEKWGDADKLPRAHTCFNRLDLPQYNSFEQLREKLKIAIESSEGFEGVD